MIMLTAGIGWKRRLAPPLPGSDLPGNLRRRGKLRSSLSQSGLCIETRTLRGDLRLSLGQSGRSVATRTITTDENHQHSETAQRATRVRHPALRQCVGVA